MVILGALTGGVLAGQNLIRAAELRSIPVETQNFISAAYIFRNKYNAIPGDKSNATRFWGDNTTLCDDGNAANNGSPGVCNGDGDGELGRSSAGAAAEGYMFWTHLVEAGLLKGEYTGAAGPNSNGHSLLGINIPKSRLDNTGWTAFHVNIGSTAINYTLNSDYGNIFMFGNESNNWETYQPALTPEEAWNIDTKMDDGKPASGKVIARYWNNRCAFANNGAHATDNLDASYKLTDTDIQCSFFFKLL